MNKSLCLVILLSSIILGCNAQSPFDYKSSWEKVDELFNKKLPESALKEIEKIEIQAKKENNSPQLIAVSIYKVKISSQYAEDFLVNAIIDFEKLVAESKFPEKNVYYSLTAQLYLQYLSSNYWEISNITTSAEKSDDINTWSRENFLEKCYDYFLKSLDNASKLQKISIDDYKVILELEENPNRYLRPTLYDILAFRALDFLSSPDNNLLGKTLSNKDYLSGYTTFSRLVLPKVTDETDCLEASVKLFQDILKFHYKNPAAFIDAELARLKFVYNNIDDFDEKDEMYLQALFSLERKYAQHESAAEIMFVIASYYNSKAIQYNPEISDEYKDYFANAIAYCQKAIKQFPETNGGKRCYNLAQQIENKEIASITIPIGNYPNEHFPASISYKNINELYIKIVPLNFIDEFFTLNLTSQSQSETNLDLILSKKPVKELKFDIPITEDYRSHIIEIILPKLEIGAYAIVACSNNSFDRRKDQMASGVFQVTKLNSIVLDSKNDMEFIVGDRNSGHQIKNCEVSFYQTEGWGKTAKQILVTKQKTNDKGKLIINKAKLNKLAGKSSGYSTYSIIINSGNDNFLFQNYANTYTEHENIREQSSFFLDRAIYRPGQTVYFKNILHKGSNTDYAVIPNKTVQINLKDNNYKTISTLNLKTNEFGSCSGEFILPNNCLPGVYTIENGNNTAYFNVEEYKRPSFEIKFEKVSKQNIANSEVCVKVNAKSLTGISLNNATVKYSVKRASYFYYRSNNNVAITNGTINLDENGDGTICFTATCPKNKSYYFPPTYYFTISVDVTDNSGETISGNYTVRVSDKSLFLTSYSQEYVTDEFVIGVTSIDGEPIETDLQIKLYKLTEPENIVRPRLWNETPDTFIYSEKEFKDKLPKDVYKDEDSYKKWEKGKLIATYNDSDGNINLKDLKLSAGYYVVEASTKDKYNNDVEENFYFCTYNKEKQHVFSKEGISLSASNYSVNPGEKFQLYLSSNNKKTNVRLLVYSPTRILYDDYISINSNKILSFDIKEEDKGSIYAIASASFNNRVYNESTSINVPYFNKSLNINLLTERSIITPGATEKWTVSVKDYQDKIVNAEVLATMYDMSLDYFTSNYNSRFNFSLSPKSNFRFSFGEHSNSTRQWGINNYNHDYKRIDPVAYDNFKLGYDYYPVYYGGSRNTMLKQSARSDMIVSSDMPEAAVEESSADFDNFDDATLSTDMYPEEEEVQSIRRDFRETAFFYPQLKTDKEGNVEFEFVVPESMTKWNFRAWAHTKDLSSGFYGTEFISQKDIFIQANTPKILYEKDIINYSARISNLSSASHYGTAFIEVYNLQGENITNKVIDVAKVHFNVNENSSAYVGWKLSVPENVGVLKIRCGAETDAHTDVEEHIIPVLTTKVLITESLPLTVNNKGLNKYTFESFKNKFGNPKYSTQSMTVEYSANPIWYAVQSLPFLSEGDEIFTLTVFNKLYSNLIAEHIVKNNPKIQEVYKQVKETNPESFVSQLAQNQELKNILLSETPWVLDAENEQEQRERMALLFDKNKISYTKRVMFEKLQNMKHVSGAFSWIEDGYYPSFYITLNVVTGFANLYSLGIISYDYEVGEILNSAIEYLDDEIIKTYKDLEKNKSLDKYVVSSDIVKYLYARHIFAKEYKIKDSKAYDFFMSCMEKNWNVQNLETQAMIATTLFDTDKKSIADLIMQSLSERALHSEELGMYWRDFQRSYTYSSSIVTMSALIECYHKTGDKKSVSEMQRWLLNHKRTNSWQSAPATSKAIYALLLDNSSKITVKSNDKLMIGDFTVDMGKAGIGAGYIKNSFPASKITKDFSKISIDKTTDGSTWGAVYWQYTTDYENVEAAASGLSVDRKIMKSSYKGNSIAFTEVKKGETIANTDKVVVQMVITADREYEYVHLKDILPACFIPEQKLSGYSFAANLMYYTGIKDESINFFIEYLPKGTHVIEYKINVQQSGEFTGGISKIQCMYAPEFGGQSEGIRIEVKNNQ